MPAYKAVLTVNMVFEWCETTDEMDEMFNVWWRLSDFARATDGGPIAAQWHTDHIEEIPPEGVDAALQAIGQRGHFEEDGTFVHEDEWGREDKGRIK